MDFNKIIFSKEDGIAKIVLKSPKNLNSIDIPMINDLMEVLRICDEDESVNVVILSGIGKSFSAGGDIRAMLKEIESDTPRIDKMGEKLEKLAMKIRLVKKPLIAAVHGPVAGAGFNLALLCDFRIAADNSKFIQAFIKNGLVTDAGGAYVLTKMLGVAKTTELVMLGETIDANKAYDFGFVNKVVGMEDLESEAMKLANKICNLPSIAIANLKSMINLAGFDDFKDYLKVKESYQKR